MKKILFLTFLLCLAFCSSANANTKLDDDNLVLFYQHQGYQSYLFRDSLQTSFDDSLRIISFNFFIFDSIQPSRTRWDKVESMQFAFDESNRKVYFFDHNGNLIFLDPNGSIADGSGYAPAAEIVYFLTTGNRFYSTFDDDFYDTLAVG